MNALRALREGETIEIEGVEAVMDGDGRPRKRGEWYVAQRNTGPHLLVVHSFGFYHGPDNEVEQRDEIGAEDWPSWIHPEGTAYSFDYDECVKVKLTLNGETI